MSRSYGGWNGSPTAVYQSEELKRTVFSFLCSTMHSLSHTSSVSSNIVWVFAQILHQYTFTQPARSFARFWSFNNDSLDNPANFICNFLWVCQGIVHVFIPLEIFLETCARISKVNNWGIYDWHRDKLWLQESENLNIPERTSRDSAVPLKHNCTSI